MWTKRDEREKRRLLFFFFLFDEACGRKGGGVFLIFFGGEVGVTSIEISPAIFLVYLLDCDFCQA